MVTLHLGLIYISAMVSDVERPILCLLASVCFVWRIYSGPLPIICLDGFAGLLSLPGAELCELFIHVGHEPLYGMYHW